LGEVQEANIVKVIKMWCTIHRIWKK